MDHETVRAAYAALQPKLNLNLYDIDLPLFCPSLPFPFFLALLFLTLFETNPGTAHEKNRSLHPSRSSFQVESSRAEPSCLSFVLVKRCVNSGLLDAFRQTD